MAPGTPASPVRGALLLLVAGGGSPGRLRVSTHDPWLGPKRTLPPSPATRMDKFSSPSPPERTPWSIAGGGGISLASMRSTAPSGRSSTTRRAVDPGRANLRVLVAPSRTAPARMARWRAVHEESTSPTTSETRSMSRPLSIARQVWMICPNGSEAVGGPPSPDLAMRARRRPRAIRARSPNSSISEASSGSVAPRAMPLLVRMTRTSSLATSSCNAAARLWRTESSASDATRCACSSRAARCRRPHRRTAPITRVNVTPNAAPTMSALGVDDCES